MVCLSISLPHPCVQSGRTALYYATRNKHAEIVSLLVQDDAFDDDICTEVCTVYVCVCVCTYETSLVCKPARLISAYHNFLFPSCMYSYYV